MDSIPVRKQPEKKYSSFLSIPDADKSAALGHLHIHIKNKNNIEFGS